MPFTLSHPAAIIPFHKWFGSRLPLSALVIGSMAPDFAYFLPGSLGPLSHSLRGLFYFCLPSGLLVLWIFQQLLKQPSIALLPNSIRERIPRSPPFSALTYFWAALALLVGAATHMFWDSFTHLRSSLFGIIPLMQIVIDIGGEPVRVYKLLQHISTIAGIVVIAIWLYRMWKSPGNELDANQSDAIHSIAVPNLWRISSLGTIAVSSVLSALVQYALHPNRAIESELFYLSIGGMAGFAAAWVLVSIVINARYGGLNR